MTKKRRRYASDFKARDYIYAPQHPFPFSWPRLNELHPPTENKCFLVALDNKQLDLIHSYLSLAGYYRLWGLPHKRVWTQAERQQWDEIQSFTSELECCLMNGCDVSQLIDKLEEIKQELADGNTLFDFLVGQINVDLDQLTALTDLSHLNNLDTMSVEATNTRVVLENHGDRLGEIKDTLNLGLIGQDGPYLDNLSLLVHLSELQELRTLDDIVSAMQRCCGSTQTQDQPNAGLTQPQLDEKCKKAYLIFDTVELWINRLEQADSDGILGSVLAGSIVGAIVWAVSAVFDGPLWFGDALGLVGAVIAALMTTQVNFEDVIDDLTLYKSDIICALYNARDTDDAIAAFTDALKAGQSSQIEVSFMTVLVAGSLVNILFQYDFVVPADFVPSGDCSACGGGGGSVAPIDTCAASPEHYYGSPTAIDANGYPINGLDINAEYADGYYRVAFRTAGWYKATIVDITDASFLEVWTYDCEFNPHDCDGGGIGSDHYGTEFSFQHETQAFSVKVEYEAIAQEDVPQGTCF